MQIYSPTLSGSTDVLGPLIQTGSLTSTGTITAQSLVITSTTRLTGSVSISGSLSATSSWANNAVTASYALSSSLAANAVSASYALSSSFSSNAISSSYALNATSASYASSSTSASYAINATNGFPYIGTATITGSLIVSGSSIRFDIPSKVNGYSLVTDANGNATWQAVGAAAGFPFNGAAVITGSLSISGSGINIIGNSRITGSLTVGGTTTITGSWNSNFTNGLHFAFGSNTGNIYSLQNGTAWRRLDIEANPLVLNGQSGGNVGINKINPNAKLDVNGNTIITGSLTVTNGLQGTATSADAINGYQVASIDNVNTGATGSNSYSNIVRSEELEQSKHTTINIFNFLNFS